MSDPEFGTDEWVERWAITVRSPIADPGGCIRNIVADALEWAAEYMDGHPEACDWDAAYRGLRAKAAEIRGGGDD